MFPEKENVAVVGVVTLPWLLVLLLVDGPVMLLLCGQYSMESGRLGLLHQWMEDVACWGGAVRVSERSGYKIIRMNGAEQRLRKATRSFIRSLFLSP